jgi:uncharacterized membrane protein
MTADLSPADMVVPAVVVAAGGVALAAIGVLARMSRLRRNRFAGIRTRATLSSDEAWRAGHNAAASYLIAAGIAWIAAAAALAFSSVAALLLFALGVALVVVAAVVGDRASRRARPR